MTEVKDIVYSGILQGWSKNSIISQIMFKIASEEESKLLEFWCDLPELKSKAENLYNKYRCQYYKEY